MLSVLYLFSSCYDLSSVMVSNFNSDEFTVICSGFIGHNWAMLFACAGYEVKIYDSDYQVVAGALDKILVQLKSISDAGMSRGQLSVTEQYQLISGAQSMADCVSSAIYVQV